MSKLTPADDEFHDPPEPDPTWAETAWFAAQIPERGMGVWLYPLFRRSLGVMSCHIWVWGPGATELWQHPYYRHYWHLPIPEGIRLSSFELPNGLAYRTLEPLSAYELRYRDGDALSVDLTFRAIHPAHELGITDEHGHIDQLGRVEGQIVLYGETIPIDCIEMRDRTWSPRREKRDRTWLGYSYGAASETYAFQQAVKVHPETGDFALLGGFTLRDGAKIDLASGRRLVERDEAGRPAAITVDAVQSDGTTFTARGEVVSQMPIHTSPYFVWVSQVRWTMPDGSEAWGEDQETWSPGALRAMLKGRPEASAATRSSSW
jgi:hypothetical protein